MFATKTQEKGVNSKLTINRQERGQLVSFWGFDC